MSKLFEALKRAEKERSVQAGPPPSFPAVKVGGLKIAPQPVAEYHRLKFNILRLNCAQKLDTLLFCSSTPGEGVSTALVNFAVTLAMDGDRVLLVDANLRNPSLHAFFNLPMEKGLTDLLLGRCTLPGVIKKSGVSNLYVITGGVRHENPITVLEAGSFRSRFEEIKTDVSWVLFDSPATNTYADSIVLAGKVDGVVMVLEAEKTRWEVVESSRQRIIKGNGKILGVVLNKRRFHVPEWLYKRL